MTRRERNYLATGLGIGVWFVPITQVLAARFAHRHFLDIVTKETP